MQDNTGFTQLAEATASGVQNAGDELLLVKFFMDPLQNSKKSLEEGRPIFDDVEWISIKSPGSRDERVRPVRPGDKERFPKHYAAFKNRTDQEAVSGTPLTEWTGISRSQAEELKFLNIVTVEQLAGCSDQNTQNFKGLQTLKQNAKAFLDAASGRNVELESALQTIEELKARLDALEKPKRKRRTKAEMEAEKETTTVPEE